MKVEIAGSVLHDPVEAIASWIGDNEKVVRNYDLVEQDDPNVITAREILATQYTKLRVDSMELQYFVDQGAKAPWELLPVGTRLQEADPAEEGDLYDDAETFYNHFYTGRRHNLTFGKIHRVLHLKRPHFFPLLDGRVHAIYKDKAKEVSLKHRDVRRGRRGRLFWAAIREDLINAGDAWEEIRLALADRDEPESLGAQLSDVRLHDILCWELAPDR